MVCSLILLQRVLKAFRYYCRVLKRLSDVLNYWCDTGYKYKFTGVMSALTNSREKVINSPADIHQCG